jgi:DNA-binding IscR family transcriptional regulator
MAKITGLLVKANILRSQRGATGGVLLARDPQSISLLSIVEACQGLLIGNYCEDISDHPDPVCAFHEAMKEAHTSLINVLSKWTLENLRSRPGPADPSREEFCKMGFSCQNGNGLCCLGENALGEDDPAAKLRRK